MLPQAYSEPYQTSKMEGSAEIFNEQKPSTTFSMFDKVLKKHLSYHTLFLISNTFVSKQKQKAKN